MEYFRAARVEHDGSLSYLKDINTYIGIYEEVCEVRDATLHVLLFSHREGYSRLAKHMHRNGFNFEMITEEEYKSYES